MSLRSSVTVRVPATSANMGPGFDAVGVALNIYNDLTVSTVDPSTGRQWESFHMDVEGEGAEGLPRDDTNLVCQGLKLAFVEASLPLPPLHYHLVNRIPVGAGLGSSSAAIVAGLLAGLALTGHPLAVENEEKALQLAATVEGHVDNLAPCIYGGMQVGVHTGQRWYTTAVNVPTGLQCVLFIPEIRQSTEGARAILPKTIPRSDAVYNIGRVALLINAFASGNLDDLQLATQDALHQPARCKIMPWLSPCIEAALATGAKGAFLSGAGSSVMAITSGRKGDIHGQVPSERRDIEVARAMARAAHGAGYRGRILVTQPTQIGAHVIAFDGDANAVVSGRGLGIDVLSTGELGDIKAQHFTGPISPSPSHSSLSSTAAAAAGNGASTTAAPATASPPRKSVTYVSTRATGAAAAKTLTFAQAVFAGLAPDGGLYVPAGGAAAFPRVEAQTLDSWRQTKLPYFEVAARVMGMFIGDDQIPYPDLVSLCKKSYGDGTDAGKGNWSTSEVAPVVAVPYISTNAAASPATGGTLYLAEHFHGPTCAFKDLALQFLGNAFEYLLGKARKDTATKDKESLPTRLTILGATSGDTGSAAIAGLRGKTGVEVFILHPAGRVARVQELQMTTTLDANVHNIAVEGAGADFDACQAAVKAAFGDESFRSRHSLSAINSINWARILAQVVYYVWTYLRWADEWEAKNSGTGGASVRPKPSFVVPTGNFGNALAAHYARRLGVPIATVCVATNKNDIMHRFISAADYSCSTVHPTLAPSMDIQVSSNLERYLYAAAYAASTANDAATAHEDAASQVRSWTGELGSHKRVSSFPAAVLAQVQSDFTSAAADDGTIDNVIKAYLSSPTSPYALCPHTACGVHAVSAVPSLHEAATRGEVVVMATAHPAKFASGTPSLAAAGLYYREVEGQLGKPVVPIDGAAPGAAAPSSVAPRLPAQLLGLSSRPRQCAIVNNDVGAIKDFVDAVSKARGLTQ